MLRRLTPADYKGNTRKVLHKAAVSQRAVWILLLRSTRPGVLENCNAVDLAELTSAVWVKWQLCSDVATAVVGNPSCMHLPSRAMGTALNEAVCWLEQRNSFPFQLFVQLDQVKLLKHVNLQFFVTRANVE